MRSKDQCLEVVDGEFCCGVSSADTVACSQGHALALQPCLENEKQKKMKKRVLILRVLILQLYSYLLKVIQPPKSGA